jgi:hypothetical protein
MVPREYPTLVGTKLRSYDIFDFQSSRLLDPLEELRLNKPLEEIKNERTTLSTRLLPDKHNGTAIGKYNEDERVSLSTKTSQSLALENKYIHIEDVTKRTKGSQLKKPVNQQKIDLTQNEQLHVYQPQ